MKHPTFRGLLRLAAFLLGLALIVAFANTFCIKTDIYAALTMAEVKARSDIEVAFVGSSIVRDHFNAEMISKEIGKTCFALGIPCGMLQGNIASTRELYRKNSPEWTILVIEPFTVDSAKEGIEGQYDLLPFLSSPFEQLRYYYSVAKEDGWYVDRAFMFRDYAVDSFGEFMETVGMHLRPFRTYEKIRPTLDPRMTYMGSGYSRCDTDERATEMVRQQIIREYTGYVYDLLPQTREMLLEYRDLVAQKGSKLLVFIYPNMTAHNLAIPGFLDYADALTRFCGENDMPCVNFSYAKPELYPRETDQYYFDLYHMVGEGADIAGIHIARALGLGAAGDKLNRGSHVVMGHVVEHDDVGAGLHGLAHHVQVLAFDLDRRGKRCMGARHLDCTRHATGGIDVVVLEHDGRRQVVTVVAAAADLDCGLLEDTHARRGLARVDKHGLGALERSCHPMRVSSDAAHALQVVERHALARKQYARIAAHLAHVVAGVHLVTIGNI